MIELPRYSLRIGRESTSYGAPCLRSRSRISRKPSRALLRLRTSATRAASWSGWASEMRQRARVASHGFRDRQAIRSRLTTSAICMTNRSGVRTQPDRSTNGRTRNQHRAWRSTIDRSHRHHALTARAMCARNPAPIVRVAASQSPHTEPVRTQNSSVQCHA